MTSIERNEVDISKLFQWKKEVELLDLNGEIILKAFIRLVGDENLNKAKVYGLRKSAELRKKLKDSNSDECLAYLPEKEFVEKENIIEQLLFFKVRDYTSKAVNELTFNIPVEPNSDSTLEDQENYQNKIDGFPQDRNNQIKEYVTKLVDKDREKYLNISFDLIFKEYIDLMINQYCEAEMILRFREMCVFYGTFSDSELKNRLFESIEQFQDLPKEIKDQLVDSYLSLEIGGEDLKK